LLLRNPKIVLLVAGAGLVIHQQIAPEDNILDNTLEDAKHYLDGIGGTH
jgi:hypothetical protein